MVGWLVGLSREAEAVWAMAVGRSVEETGVWGDEFLVLKALYVSGGRWGGRISILLLHHCHQNRGSRVARNAAVPFLNPLGVSGLGVKQPPSDAFWCF